MLVDAGPQLGWPLLRRRLDALNVTAASLAGLVLTHSHFDHTENAAHVKETYSAKIFIHSSEANFLLHGDNPVVHGTNPVVGLITTVLAKKNVIQLLKYKPVAFDVQVDDQYDLNDAGFLGYIIHTPGHSPGSMSVIIDNEIALVGDAMFGIFNNKTFPPFALDAPQLVSSWRILLDTGCSLYLPAHGSARSREILQNEYDKYHRKFNLK